MRNFTHRCSKSGHFPPKLGQFFPIFEKGQGDLPPPPSSYAPDSNLPLLLIVAQRRLDSSKFVFLWLQKRLVSDPCYVGNFSKMRQQVNKMYFFTCFVQIKRLLRAQHHLFSCLYHESDCVQKGQNVKINYRLALIFSMSC